MALRQEKVGIRPSGARNVIGLSRQTFLTRRRNREEEESDVEGEIRNVKMSSAPIEPLLRAPSMQSYPAGNGKKEEKELEIDEEGDGKGVRQTKDEHGFKMKWRGDRQRRLSSISK